MRQLLTTRLSLCLGSLFLFTHCSGGTTPFDGTGAGGGAIGSAGGATGTGSTNAGIGGGTVDPGVGGSGTTVGAGGEIGNSGGTGGAVGNAGGAIGSDGGAVGNAGGAVGSDGGAVGSDGGATGVGGSGEDLDGGGKANAVPGETTDVVQDYLRLGEIRILNNNWGSHELGCDVANPPKTTMDVYVDNEGSFGWHFNRGDCADASNTSQPDFPQVEFGIHPFGLYNELVTSPNFSSTILLPRQLTDITSASVTVDQFTLALGGNQSSWNSAMEFWLSEGDPRSPSGEVQVHTEVMAWWGWNGNRWPCDEPYGTDGSNGSEGQTVGAYTVCHQSDTWAGNQWRYYQFRAGSSSTNFNGKIDVGAFLQYLQQKDSDTYHGDLWLTRMEVGTEIDDMTEGTVKMRGITFEVNGVSKSAIIGTP